MRYNHVYNEYVRLFYDIALKGKIEGLHAKKRCKATYKTSLPADQKSDHKSVISVNFDAV